MTAIASNRQMPQMHRIFIETDLDLSIGRTEAEKNHSCRHPIQALFGTTI